MRWIWSTDGDERLWEQQLRHCWSPDGRLLTWCSTPTEGRIRREMFRLGDVGLPAFRGDEIRELWGGTPG